MGQGALSKPVVKWWLSLNSSTGGEALPNVARVIRQAYPLTIMTIDRDTPPDSPYLS